MDENGSKLLPPHVPSRSFPIPQGSCLDPSGMALPELWAPLYEGRTAPQVPEI